MYKLILIIFLPYIAFSQNVWEKIDLTGPKNVVDIFCPDSNNCFLVSNFTGEIYKTTNKGETWEFLFDDHLNYKDFDIELSFPDSLNYFIPYYGGCGIVRTSDGFKTKDTICNGLINIHNVFKMYDKNIGFTWRFEVDTSGGELKEYYYYVSTFDGFDTEKKIKIDRVDNQPFMTDAQFINDSIIFLLNYYIDTVSLRYQYVIESFNLKSQEKILLSKLDYNLNLVSMFKTDNIIYLAGTNERIKNVGSRDFMLKSTDNGKTWKCVLDIFYSHLAYNVEAKYSDSRGFGTIKFKNDSVGIATGSDYKICYTYDAGESWYYEREQSKEMLEIHLLSSNIEYAGDTPLYLKYNDYLFRMTEDNLAPKPQDILVISGYVMEDEKPQAEIPVALDNRITMTDSSGYYQFIQIRPGKEYTLQVYNKYFNYRPFFYYPDKIQISTINDTIINFQASSKKIFHNISGNVYNNQVGIKDISIQSIKHISTSGKEYDTVKTNEEGFYLFENIEQGFNYTYKAFSDEYTFTPEEYSYVGITEDKTGFNFVAGPITSVKSNPNFEFKNNILYSKEIVGHTYRLIDLQGRVIKSSNLSPTLDFNYLDSGTYILQVMKNNSEVFSEKFQVVR